MPDERVLEVHREGGVCVLTLNRPAKLNALNGALEAALVAAIESDPVRTSRCLVIVGNGRAFCAGADVSEFDRSAAADILDYYATTGDVYERIARLPQPTIAAIHGYCLGGGFELALACDYRIVHETARFGFPEVAIGIVPSSGGLHRLVRLVGPAKARELAILRTTDRISAAEAQAIGLVTDVVGGEVLEAARERATAICALPPLAVTLTGLAIDAIADGSREAGALIERLAYGMLAPTADAQEAATAFTEKRTPRFTGR